MTPREILMAWAEKEGKVFSNYGKEIELIEFVIEKQREAQKK